MDLARFLADEPAGAAGRRGLTAFARRAAAGFNTEVASLIGLLRSSPRGLVDPLAAPASLHLQMVETGGVRHRPDGRLIFSSPIIGRRYRAVANPQELLWMAASVSPALADRPVEVVGEALRTCLREEAPRATFVQFAQVLTRRGVSHPRLYAADRDNAKLWSQLLPLGMPGAWPLNDDCNAGFVSVARTGKWHLADNQELHVAVFGSLGRVEMVVAGHVHPSGCKFDDSVRLRELRHLCTAAEPALGSALELLSARRSLRLQRKLFHRLQNGGAERHNPMISVAQIADCSAVAVIERSPTAWVVSNLAVVGASTSKHAWSDMLAYPKATPLTAIALHRSRRGVVLTEPRIRQVFPHVRSAKEDCAAFIYPVWNGEACRLVTYLFEGQASREISGIKQVELSTAASLAATA